MNDHGAYQGNQIKASSSGNFPLTWYKMTSGPALTHHLKWLRPPFIEVIRSRFLLGATWFPGLFQWRFTRDGDILQKLQQVLIRNSYTTYKIQAVKAIWFIYVTT